MVRLQRLLEGQALPGDADRLGHSLERFLTTGAGAALAAAQESEDPAVCAQALEAVLKTIHESYAPAVVRGSQLVQQLQESRLLPTGCTSIDQGLLRGGLREGQLTEVCGESASGKTQLCLMAAAHTVSRGERVVYIDTSNAFSARRLVEMMSLVAGAQLAVERALELVAVHAAYDVHAVLAVLDSLLRQQKPGPSLVVVDSLSAVVAPVLGGGGGQHSMGHALLAGVGAALKALALRCEAAVIVTNHMVGGGEGGRGEKRPAMGESWKNQPHVRLQLSPAVVAASAAGPAAQRAQQAQHAAEQHVATLRASTFGPPGEQATYWLAPAGLVSQPPMAAVAS